MSLRNTLQRQKRMFSNNEAVVLVCLFLSFLDFKLYSMHFMVMALAFACLLGVRIPISRGVIPALLLTCSLMPSLSDSLASPSMWMRRIVWPAAFLLGYGLIWSSQIHSESKEIFEKRANTLFALAAFGFITHLVLNLGINFGQESSNRNMVDIWTEKNRAATGQAAIACVPLAWCVAFIAKDIKLKKKMLAILAMIAMLYYNLELGNRTMTVILAVLFAIVMLYSIKKGEKSEGKRRGRYTIWGVIVIALLIYCLNIGNIQSVIRESTLFERLFSEEKADSKIGGRWLYKLEYIKRMPSYLFGGNHIKRIVGSYAHDVLLDTYDEVGLLGFLAVLALLWDGIAKMWRAIHCEKLDSNTKLTIFCIYCAIFLTFAVEPILAGMPWLLMTYCFFHGIVTCLVESLSYENK